MRDIVQGTATPAAAASSRSFSDDARPGASADDDGSATDAYGSHADADDVAVAHRPALLKTFNY
jgi:hypothetical protein